MKALLNSTLLIGLMLAGCASNPSSTTGTIAGGVTTAVETTVNSLTGVLPTNVSIVVKQIQAASVTACGFLPTALSITSLFSGNTAVSTASDAVSAICSVVNKSTTSTGLRRHKFGGANSIGSYDGVPISGTFVK